MSTHADIETPLSLCTEEQIIDEMARRNDALVLIRMRRVKDAKDNQSLTSTDYRGGFIVCLGLVAECMARLNAQCADKHGYDVTESDDE